MQIARQLASTGLMQTARPIPRPLMVAGGGILLLIAAGLLFALYQINPSTTKVFPGCFFFSLTGLYCPGCGATRALHHLLHGELAAAMAMNPLFVLSLPLMTALILRPQLARIPATTYTITVVVISYFVLRNIPVWPFKLLAPHQIF